MVRLHELLANVFPDTPANHTKAALMTHVILRVRGEDRPSVRITYAWNKGNRRRLNARDLAKPGLDSLRVAVL